MAACASRQPRPRPRQPDPTVQQLDRLLASSAGAEDLRRCLAEVEAEGLCDEQPKRRRFDVRVVLDPRYRAWQGWRSRLDRTYGCVNELYAGTGVSWKIAGILDWDPGRDRHDLRVLLARLRRTFKADRRSLLLGVTVWEPRRVFSTAGGEIGLAQSGACVVPSWPRIENDCVILAHELGHLIGARHVRGKSWVMGWSARPFHLPAADPLARVVATYRFHPRNVAAVAAHRSARYTERGLKPAPECKRKIARIDRCYFGSP